MDPRRFSSLQEFQDFLATTGPADPDISAGTGVADTALDYFSRIPSILVNDISAVTVPETENAGVLVSVPDVQNYGTIGLSEEQQTAMLFRDVPFLVPPAVVSGTSDSKWQRNSPSTSYKAPLWLSKPPESKLFGQIQNFSKLAANAVWSGTGFTALARTRVPAVETGIIWVGLWYAYAEQVWYCVGVRTPGYAVVVRYSTDDCTTWTDINMQGLVAPSGMGGMINGEAWIAPNQCTPYGVLLVCMQDKGVWYVNRSGVHVLQPTGYFSEPVFSRYGLKVLSYDNTQGYSGSYCTLYEWLMPTDAVSTPTLNRSKLQDYSVGSRSRPTTYSKLTRPCYGLDDTTVFINAKINYNDGSSWLFCPAVYNAFTGETKLDVGITASTGYFGPVVRGETGLTVAINANSQYHVFGSVDNGVSWAERNPNVWTNPGRTLEYQRLNYHFGTHRWEYNALNNGASLVRVSDGAVLFTEQPIVYAGSFSSYETPLVGRIS